MSNIFNYDRNEIGNYFVSIGDKAYKKDQLFDWLYKKRIISFSDITNMKKDVVDRLISDYSLFDIKIIKKEQGKDVIKYLFELSDSEKIEAVLMFHDYGNSLCINSIIANYYYHFLSIPQ